MITCIARRRTDACCDALTGHGRSRRVLILLIGIVLLSAADLAITLTHLQGAGMLEANPIAAWLVKTTQSSWTLGAFKGLTVAIAVTVLFCLRRYRQGEIAAWCGLGILVGVSLMWHSYTEELQPDDSPEMLLSCAELFGDQWLVLD